MRKLLYTLSLLLTAPATQAQTKIDSLYSVWNDTTQTDSIRANAFVFYIGYGFLNTRPDSAFILAEELYHFGLTNNIPRAQYEAYNLQGISWNNRGDAAKALNLYAKSLSMAKQNGDNGMVASITNNTGGIYLNQGNYPKALDHYIRALKIYEDLGRKSRVAGVLASIGVIYKHQGDYTKALEYGNRALKIAEEFNDKNKIASQLVNLGTVYKMLGKDSTALAYNKRAIVLFDETGNKYNKANALNNTGSIYHGLGDYTKAIKYYKLAIELADELDDKRKIARALYNIGGVYQNQGNYPKALEYCKQGLTISEETGSLLGQETACQCLYDTYKAMENSNEALAYHEKMIVIKDSIYNKENTKKLTQLEMQYEFDKKDAAAQAEQEKKDAVASQELQRQKLVRNGFMGGFAVVLLFAGVFFVQRNRIGKEKERSEELLLNILPEETAQELKEKGHSDAQLIDHVTVLFTDFKGFTSMAEQLSPKELVNDLNICFSEFDRIMQKYGIEKIKTIGDAYMAAGGLPTPNDTHAMDVIQATFEMRDFVEAGKAQKVEAGLPYFEIRIGVNTGPVVAGIVGVKKFQYDIWGDTVNTASRMESSGEVGKVNISQATYELLKDEAGFTFESRGKIEAKGKGEIEMYFVSNT